MKPTPDPPPIPHRSRVLGINRRNLDLVFARHRPGRFRILDDKLATKELLTRAGIPTPRTLGTIRTSSEMERLTRLMAEHDELVIKPASGSGGKGILILTRRESVWTGSGTVYSPQAVAAHVGQILTGAFSMDESPDTALFEERIHPHPFFREVYSEGLADIRIVMHKGVPIQAMCRLPSRLSEGKANLHSGGIGVGVDLESGRTRGGVSRGSSVNAHPDSLVSLEGLQIPDWEQCLDLAVRAARTVDIEYLGVDIVLDRNRGPVILEMNARPGLDIQIANRSGQSLDTAPSPPLERLTFLATWLILGLLAASPILNARWQHRESATTPPVSVASPAAAGLAPGEDYPPDDAGEVQWDEGEIPLSSIDETFKNARLAIASGDTTRALELYRTAAQDSAVAPFALNNIALIHRRRAEYSEAQSALEAALRRFPSYTRGHYNLGLILMDQGRRNEALASFQTALIHTPNHPASWAKVGDIQLEAGRIPEAIESFTAAVRYDPGSARYRLGLARALRAGGHFEDAAASFLQALALDPDSQEAAFGWARSLVDGPPGAFAAVGPDSIATVLRSVLGKRPKPERYRELLADMEWQRGHLPEALVLYDGLAAPENRTFTLAAATVAQELGAWGRAIAYAEEPGLDQDRLALSIQALSSMGRSLEEGWPAPGTRPAGMSRPFPHPVQEALRLLLNGESRAAESAIGNLPDEDQELRPILEVLRSPDRTLPETGTASWPTWLRSHLPGTSSMKDRLASPQTIPRTLLLWMLARRGEDAGSDSLSAAAVAVLRDICPSFHPLLRADLESALLAGDFKRAERFAQTMRLQFPEDPRGDLSLASIYLKTRTPADARAVLERIPESERSLPEAIRVEAGILIEEGNTGKGIQLLASLAKKSPSDTAVRIALADGYFKAGKRRRGVENLQIALDLSPGDAALRRRLARGLIDLRRYPEAIAEWERLVLLDETNLSDRFNLALSLQRDNRLEEAVRVYDRILASDSTRIKAWFNRSLALEKLGRTTEAREGYEHILTLEPDHARSLEKLATMTGESNP